jgi:hypothetical protein
MKESQLVQMQRDIKNLTSIVAILIEEIKLLKPKENANTETKPE